MGGNDSLLAGAGKADITPEMGIQIAGDIGNPRPVEEIHNPLYARALVLESAGRRACFISTDVTGIMRKYALELRRRAAECLDTQPDAVMPHATQSHSSPGVGHAMISADSPLAPDDLPWLRGGDDRYNEPFLDGVIEAVKAAKESLQPVTMKAVRGMDGRVSFNRRFILRDGTAQTHPGLCNPEVLCCEGPTDPEVGIAVFEDKAGRAVAALLHHTCHPVHGYAYRYICPDWPGLWAEEVSRLIGGGCIAMTANGACGNIHHTNHLDPNYKRDVNKYVACLTETAQRILPDLRAANMTPLDWSTKVLQLPLREDTPEELDAARKLLDEHPEPMWNDKKTRISWDWVHALRALDLEQQREKQSWYDYEIQMIRVGGLALVAWPGEPFVEAQLELKKNSPAAHTFVAHFSNGWPGYQPTREAFERGGFETRWTTLAKGALERVTSESKRMLASLFES